MRASPFFCNTTKMLRSWSCGRADTMADANSISKRTMLFLECFIEIRIVLLLLVVGLEVILQVEVQHGGNNA